MGNSNNKLEKKFSSLPPQYFPAITHRNQQSSIFRKLSRAAKRRSHDLGFLQKSLERNDSHGPLVDALFEPEYPIISSVTEADFTVSEVIAKGAFGNVLRVQRGADKIAYAMKVMKKSQVIVDGAVQQCKDEATIQNAVGHHPFIVKPYFYFQNKENVYIVMEYIPRGELFAAWTACDCFGETLVRLYITEIAMVLDFLHRSGIIYRDLKMENILIDAQGHIQVIDFGLAKWLKKGHRTRTVCGTLQYIAPEVLNMQPYSHSADWWTLGVLMYALLVGEYPVLGANNHFEMAEKVNSHAYELPAEFSYSNECRQAVRNLCKKDPRDRIHSIQTLHKEPFFHCLNFDAVIQKQVRPNLEEELQAVFEGYTFSNGNISRSTSLADNLDHSSTSRGRMQRDWSVVWNESVASLDASFL